MQCKLHTFRVLSQDFGGKSKKNGGNLVTRYWDVRNSQIWSNVMRIWTCNVICSEYVSTFPFYTKKAIDHNQVCVTLGKLSKHISGSISFRCILIFVTIAGTFSDLEGTNGKTKYWGPKMSRIRSFNFFSLISEKILFFDVNLLNSNIKSYSISGNNTFSMQWS